jgi:hypothetical protein
VGLALEVGGAGGMVYYRNSNTQGVAEAQVYAGDYSGVVTLRP